MGSGAKAAETRQAVTAADVGSLLAKRFGDSRRYCYAYEVGVETGGACRRLDMVVVDCYASHGYAVEGIEVKVSRGDLLREVRDPQKHKAFFGDLDYYSLAAPAEVIDMSLIPRKWGVYAVKDGVLKARRKPLPLHDEDDDTGKVSKGFLASLCRNMYNKSPKVLDMYRKVRDAREEGFKAGQRLRPPSMDGEQRAALERLQDTLKLYYPDSVDRAIDGFKRYQALNLDWLGRDLETASRTINKTLDALRQGEVR